MMTRWTIGFWVCVLGLVAGCGGGTTPGNDTGTGRVDTGVGALDTGVAIDAALPPNDTNTPAADTGIDAAASASDAGNDGNVFFPDGAIMCLAGVECTNWAAAIGAASRGAAGGTVDAAVANCVVQLHRADCCGALRAYGVNHGSRMDLCTAETMCTAMYPAVPGCTSDGMVLTDTGERATRDQVRVRAVNPMSCTFGTCYDCETFRCTGAGCAAMGGITSTQCG